MSIEDRSPPAQLLPRQYQRNELGVVDVDEIGVHPVEGLPHLGLTAGQTVDAVGGLADSHHMYPVDDLVTVLGADEPDIGAPLGEAGTLLAEDAAVAGVVNGRDARRTRDGRPAEGPRRRARRRGKP